MKNLSSFLLLILSMMINPILLDAQNNVYVLDLKKHSINCTATCGVLTPQSWKVMGNHCSLTTDQINYPNHPDDSARVANVTITLNTIGNFTCSATHSEGVIIRSSINNGSWFTQSRIYPCQLTGKTITSFMLQAPAGAAVELMVTLVVGGTNSKQIFVKDGEIIIGEALVANQNTWVKRTAGPEHSPSCRVAEMDDDQLLMETISTGTGSEPYDENTLKIFPNPVNDNPIQIQLTGSKETEIVITIHDLLGRTHYSGILVNRNSKSTAIINLKEKLIPGMYVITGTGKHEYYRKTFVVK